MWRLISFVFRTVSSIYPIPGEEGGKSQRYCDSWEQKTWHTHAPIPTEAAFIIRLPPGIVQLITFSLTLSSSEVVGPSPERRARGYILDWFKWLELIGNICPNKTCYAIATSQEERQRERGERRGGKSDKSHCASVSCLFCVFVMWSSACET